MALDGVLELMADEAVETAVWDTHAELCAVWRRLLAVIGEHDRRRLWQVTGSKSEAAHLGGVLGVTGRPGTKWARVAHALTANRGGGRRSRRGTCAWTRSRTW